MHTLASWLRGIVLVAILWLLCLMAVPGWAAQTTEWAVGPAATLLSTELNSLTSTSITSAGPSTPYDNRISGAGVGYTRCRLEISATFGSAPTGQPAVAIWFRKTVDGTNYETIPTTSTVGVGAADVTIPVATGTTTTRRSIDVWCPAERFQVTLQNNSGQSMASSGNTLKLLPITPQAN